jgi:aspartate aminotransferase-like enzyme
LLERARTLPDRGYYLDLVRYAEQALRHQTPTTPALTLLLAARAQLRRIEAETPADRIRRHGELATRCHARVDLLRDGRGVDVAVLAPEGERSPTVTCIRLPADRRGPEVAAALRRRGFVIGAGYGRLKDETIRVGHMGDHTVAGLEAVMDAVEQELVAGVAR